MREIPGNWDSARFTLMSATHIGNRASSNYEQSKIFIGLPRRSDLSELLATTFLANPKPRNRNPEPRNPSPEPCYESVFIRCMQHV
jgi:hypothetical protein